VNKKISIIIITILLTMNVLVLVFSNLFKDDEIIERPNVNEPLEKKGQYISINNISNILFDNGNFKKVNANNLNNNQVNAYINGNYIGTYYLKKGRIWNLFDENDKYINYDGKLLVNSTNLNMIVRNIEKVNITDNELQYLESLLDKDIKLDELMYNEMVIVDLDNNGYKDKIVYVSNLDSNEERDLYYNVIFMEMNGQKSVILNRKIEIEDYYLEPVYSIEYVLNINNTQNDSVVFERSYFSNVGETGNIIIGYQNNAFFVQYDD